MPTDNHSILVSVPPPCGETIYLCPSRKMRCAIFLETALNTSPSVLDYVSNKTPLCRCRLLRHGGARLALKQPGNNHCGDDSCCCGSGVDRFVRPEHRRHRQP